MKRDERVRILFDYVDLLQVENLWYQDQVKNYIYHSFLSDASQDLTTAILHDPKKEITAEILIKQDGFLAGREEATFLCNALNVGVQWKKKDGDPIQKGEAIASVSGSLQDVMAVERTCVNTLQRMSGIATMTQQVIQNIERSGSEGNVPLICATRKTLWGALDKKAVALGGGATHRLGLWHGILFKDNHIDAAGGIELLAGMMKKNGKNQEVQFSEIEASSFEQVKEIIKEEFPVKAVLLDNFTPDEIVEILSWLKKNGHHEKYIIEASGGITEDNILEYATTGVDVISLGSITHSVYALDIALNII